MTRLQKKLWEKKDLIDLKEPNTQVIPHFNCLSCAKAYELQSGLTRHMKAEHPELLLFPMDFLSNDELESLIAKTKMQLVNNKCYPPAIKEHFKEDFQFKVNFEVLLKELQKIYGKLCANGKA